MKIEKQIRDHRYITEQPLEELREIASSWADRAGGQRIRNQIAELDKLLHEEYVKLPKDSKGITWNGGESRMVCYMEDRPEDDQPTDDNPAFFDGLMYDGKCWYAYSKSLNGQNVYMRPAEECRHVSRWVLRTKLEEFASEYLESSEDDRKSIINKYIDCFNLKEGE